MQNDELRMKNAPQSPVALAGTPALPIPAIIARQNGFLKTLILRNEANWLKKTFIATDWISKCYENVCRISLHRPKKTKPNYTCSGFSGKRASQSDQIRLNQT